MKKRTLFVVLLLLLVAALGATTLHAQDATPEATALPDQVLPEFTVATMFGDIPINGSSTVGPLMQAILDLLHKDGYSDQNGTISLGIAGTGGGFKAFCEDMTTLIATASRPIKTSGDATKPDELEKCQANGREPIAFRIATDGIALTVNIENDFAKDLTKDEVITLFSTAVYWDDVRPGFPHEAIIRCIPGEESGTLDYFAEVFFGKDRTAIHAATELNQSEDDNVLVSCIEGNKFAVGFFGFAYFKENASNLNLVAINGVLPSFETVESGEYILSRPLFLYSTATIMRENPQVATLIGYTLVHVGEVVDDVGYFPLSKPLMNQSMKNWLDAVGS